MNIIRQISQAIFGALNPADLSAPGAGNAIVGVDGVNKRLFSMDENGVVTFYGAKGEYNDFQGPRLLTYFADFLCETLNPPFVGTAAGSGVPTSVFYTGRRGVVRIHSSTNPSSYRYMTGTQALALTGGEEIAIVFLMANMTNTTCYLGFHDTTSNAAPANGTYLEIVGGIARAVCKAAGASTTSANTYALIADVWYKLRVIVKAGASEVEIKLTNESETTTYLSLVAASNIPSSALAAGFVAYDATSGGKPNGFFWVDYARLDL